MTDITDKPIPEAVKFAKEKSLVSGTIEHFIVQPEAIRFARDTYDHLKDASAMEIGLAIAKQSSIDNQRRTK